VIFNNESAVSELLDAEEKHGLKAEAMRELGNIQYSVRNIRFVVGIKIYYPSVCCICTVIVFISITLLIVCALPHICI